MAKFVNASIDNKLCITLADGTFRMPFESPDTNFFRATKANFFTAVEHPKLKLGIFIGDVLFADYNLVKTFSGVLCSPDGTTTIAVITSFEYIRSTTPTKINSINLEYLPIQSLLETMGKLEAFDEEQTRQMLSGDLLEQVGTHARQFLIDLDDNELLVMFTTVNEETKVKTSMDEAKSIKPKGKSKRLVKSFAYSTLFY